MNKAIYRRFQGMRYTYEITYDHAGYEVSRNGEIKRVGLVPKAFDRLLLTHTEAMDRGLFCAETDIEGLIGMDE